MVLPEAEFVNENTLDRLMETEQVEGKEKAVEKLEDKVEEKVEKVKEIILPDRTTVPFGKVRTTIPTGHVITTSSSSTERPTFG